MAREVSETRLEISSLWGLETQGNCVDCGCSKGPSALQVSRLFGVKEGDVFFSPPPLAFGDFRDELRVCGC